MGGLGLGFRRAGFEVVGFEIDWRKARVYAQNVGAAVRANVRAFSFGHLQGLVSAVIAGPPCRPYSKATPKFKRGANHPEYGLDMEIARVAVEVDPPVVVVEEVPAWNPAPLAAALRDLEYSVEFKLVAFSGYGVPTARKRWILIALRKARVSEVFRALDEMREEPPKPIDLLRDLPRGLGGFPDHRTYEVRSKLRELFPLIPPGHSLRSAYKAGLIPDSAISGVVKNPLMKHSYWLYRPPLDGLIKVVPHPRRSVLLHPLYDRPMSVREFARLMTFPDSFSFTYLNTDEAMRAIGESIPPKFSEKLAKAILCQV